MKKRIFTLIMMLALIVVGGKAFGNNEQAVYIGCTYNYTLTDVASGVNATAVVTWETNSNVEITADVNGFAIVGGATARTLGFSVKYGDPGDVIGNGLIRVVITNNEAPTCSNFITLAVTVTAAPTWTLSIAKSETGYNACQTRVGTGDNKPEVTIVSTDEPNTFTFTVTPVVTGIPDGVEFNYSYHLILPAGTGLNSYGITGIITGTNTVSHTGVTNGTLAPDVFTVRFNTTTALALQTLTATLDDLPNNTTLELTGTTASSCATIAATAGGALTQNVLVNPVPAIGSFQ